MTYDAALFAFADPTQLCLEISPTAQNQAQQQSQSFSTLSSRWNAYLNQISLSAILPWLREEYEPRAKAWPSVAALPSGWEVVNGTAIELGTTRFVFIASEAIDLSELRVPQEWVDIPSWVGDYYLAVQVEPDDGWVRIWGYCTHQQLKTRGNYDASDRTYSLDESDVISDINALWVARQLCPEEATRASVAPLAALSSTQAENLIQRLANTAIAAPRLEVPFAIWGALLEHGGWRERLYERRQGLPEQWSILQWLRIGVSEVGQQLGWGRIEFQPSFAGARSAEPTPTPTALSRQLVIAGQQYELQVIPLGNPEERRWRFELRNLSIVTSIPGGFTLRLLTEDLQPFENNADIATTAVEQLYVDVILAPGEGLVWEIEPVPENYEREILRF
ncbi:DUF1822 family protein [Coleofasciculus sp. H7-2]|uniref:DUF1822 family protein n=1 Tax=Coleofasciculus sp. H7-2 TaxID=3351545 RepID=UPI00366FFAA2